MTTLVLSLVIGTILFFASFKFFTQIFSGIRGILGTWLAWTAGTYIVLSKLADKGSELASQATSTLSSAISTTVGIVKWIIIGIALLCLISFIITKLFPNLGADQAEKSVPSAVSKKPVNQQEAGAYQVIFTGYEQRSMELYNTIRKITGCTAQEATDALSKTPVILFYGINEKTAKHYQALFKDVGGICEVHPM